MHLVDMPLKLQILVTPAVMIVILFGLVSYTLHHHYLLHEDNETIRRWGRITDRMHIAIAAAQRMQNIAHDMVSAESGQMDDLHFNYLEQDRIFADSILYPECVEEMTMETRQFITHAEQSVKHDDNIDPQQVEPVLLALIPRLETVYNAFSAQKRSAYIDYYDSFQVNGTRLVNVSLILLLSCVLAGLVLSYWTLHIVRTRLAALLRFTQATQRGEFQSAIPPTGQQDELDQLAHGLHAMTQRLMNVVAIEKVMQGSEEERKRIAMDLHDQTLADLTAVIRKIDTLPSIAQTPSDGLRYDLENIEQGIRRIINDLHPRSLDILGLQAALAAILEQYAESAQFPDYHFTFDPVLEHLLTPLQKLCLYRITQEAVRNVATHAHANRLEISARAVSGSLLFSIEDNGRGMNRDAVRHHQGHGLPNIEERVRAMGAEIFWETSRFSTGTKITLQLKLQA